jgi:predicted RNase H-like nuclease (RuvC/YqgF family)
MNSANDASSRILTLEAERDEAENKAQAEIVFWERKVHALESQLTALQQENETLLRELGKPATSTDGNPHSPTGKA